MRGAKVLLIAGLTVALVTGPLEAVERPHGGTGTSARAKGKQSEEIKALAIPAYALASVAVSSVQAPLRGVACVGTAIVGGFAWLLVNGDAEARKGPRDAIRKVCAGPYITTPGDLRGKRK
ncbi:MAG: hypothetical protein ACE5HK_05930 [Candidatus Methylomirabilales bacterium]